VRVPAGGPGDDPVTDIVPYRLSVFGPEIDLIVAEIVALGARRALYNEYKLFNWTPLSQAQTADLVAFRDRLVAEGRSAGWEIDRTLQEVRESGRRHNCRSAHLCGNHYIWRCAAVTVRGVRRRPNRMLGHCGQWVVRLRLCLCELAEPGHPARGEHRCAGDGQGSAIGAVSDP
jgi:hypothetical protein